MCVLRGYRDRYGYILKGQKEVSPAVLSLFGGGEALPFPCPPCGVFFFFLFSFWGRLSLQMPIVEI